MQVHALTCLGDLCFGHLHCSNISVSLSMLIPFQVLELTQRPKGLSINVKNNVNKITADAFSGVGLHHGICFRDPHG